MSLASVAPVRPATPRERYAWEASKAGCPLDQIRNFRRGFYVAQPKQLQFHAAARAADTDGPTQIGFGGARGPGKSHAIMAQIVLDDCQRVSGLKALFLRSVGKAARESFEDLLGKVCPQYLGDYQPGNARLVLPNGSRVILGGFRTEGDISKYLGLEYDAIGVEEATLLQQSYYDQIRGSLRSTRPDWRTRIYNSTNPGGVGHAWYKAQFVAPWRRGEEADTRFIFATYRDNAYLQVEYTDYLHGLIGWLGQAWREGDWDISAGQFFTTWQQDVHVIPAFNPPLNWRFWLAMDYGFTHWNVVYLLAEDNDGKVYVVAEHAERKWLVPRHAEAVVAMLDRWNVGRRRVWRFVAGEDVFAERGTTGGSIADQWARTGFRLSRANDDRINGAAEVLRRLGDIRAEPPIAPTLHIFENCARLIECLPSLEHDPHRPEDVLKVDTDENGNGGDDPYDTLRYGLMEVARTQYGRVHGYDY